MTLHCRVQPAGTSAGAVACGGALRHVQSAGSEIAESERGGLLKIGRHFATNSVPCQPVMFTICPMYRRLSARSSRASENEARAMDHGPLSKSSGLMRLERLEGR